MPLSQQAGVGCRGAAKRGMFHLPPRVHGARDGDAQPAHLGGAQKAGPLLARVALEKLTVRDEHHVLWRKWTRGGGGGWRGGGAAGPSSGGLGARLAPSSKVNWSESKRSEMRRSPNERWWLRWP